MTLTKAHNRMVSAAPANVVDFGAVGSGDETAKFELAADAAVANGSYTIVIPFQSFQVSSSGADAKGCSVVGSNTVLTGYIKNAYKISGITVNGINQDRRAYHPPVPYDESRNKLLARVGTNQYYMHVPSLRGGYVLHVLNNNTTTTNDSLATTTTDQTQWRITGMLRAVEVLTGYLTVSAENGTWTSTTLSAGVPAFTSGDYYEYTRSTTIGAWKEFTVTVPEDGFVSVTFLTGTTASTDIDVLIDGAVVESAIDTSSATAARWTKIYRAKPGVRVIRVENKTAGSTGLNIVGINFAPLADQRIDVSIDTYGYYRNSSFVDPVTSNSANDYAIWDLDGGVWGGSYHGGETNFTEAFYVDTATVNLSTVGDFVIGKMIQIIQTSDIDWSSVGGPVINVQTEIAAVFGGHAVSCTFTGQTRARDFFTTLIGLSDSYTSLTAPDKVDLSALANGARQPLPLGNFAEYKSSGGDTFKITHSMYDYSQIKEGGPFIWHVAGSYNKYYNALVTSGEMDCENVHSVSIFQYT